MHFKLLCSSFKADKSHLMTLMFNIVGSLNSEIMDETITDMNGHLVENNSKVFA